MPQNIDDPISFFQKKKKRQKKKTVWKKITKFEILERYSGTDEEDNAITIQYGDFVDVSKEDQSTMILAIRKVGTEITIYGISDEDAPYHYLRVVKLNDIRGKVNKTPLSEAEITKRLSNIEREDIEVLLWEIKKARDQINAGIPFPPIDTAFVLQNHQYYNKEIKRIFPQYKFWLRKELSGFKIQKFEINSDKLFDREYQAEIVLNVKYEGLTDAIVKKLNDVPFRRGILWVRHRKTFNVIIATFYPYSSELLS